MLGALGLLAARLVVGAGIAAHGAQKAFGWFDGAGLDGAGHFFEGLGFRPGRQYAATASGNEIGAGALIALGLGGPAGPALLISTMIIAQASVHIKNGFFTAKNGIELGTLYATAGLLFASVGYGNLSLDHALGIEKPLRHPALTLLALAAAVGGAYFILEQRDMTPPPGSLATPTLPGIRNGETSGTSPAQAAG